MPEPTTTSIATLATASVAVPAVTAFGVSLGFRPDVLVAGFGGSLVAIILLNTVPSEGDTWLHLVRSSARRMAVASASSITAGYLTPLALLLANVPEPLLLSMAFVIGAFAQRAMVSIAKRVLPVDPPARPVP